MNWIRRLKQDSQGLYDRLIRRENSQGANENAKSNCSTQSVTKNIRWNIENGCNCHFEVGECLESPVFRTGITEVTEWCLKFYPKGRKKSYMCGLFLCKITPTTKNCIKFTLGIENYTKSSRLKRLHFNSFIKNYHVCEQAEEIGTDNFLKIEDFLVTDCFVIVCNFSIYHPTTIEDENFVTGSVFNSCNCTLSSDFKKFYEAGCLTDVTLQVDKKQFPVHKTILAARSDVFASMFTNATNPVLIENIDSSNIDDFLQYIYSGKMDDMSVDKAIQLYPISHFYKMTKFRQKCTDILLNNISRDNVCRIAVFAYEYSDSILEKVTNQFFCNYSYDIFSDKEWEILINNKPLLAKKIMKLVSTYKAKCSDV